MESDQAQVLVDVCLHPDGTGWCWRCSPGEYGSHGCPDYRLHASSREHSCVGPQGAPVQVLDVAGLDHVVVVTVGGHPGVVL